jgi:hypothetical protein
MKKIFCSIFCLLLILIESSAQKIDNSNYYNYAVAGSGTTNWLRISDVVPIIIDELKKNGVEYHTIGVGELLKVNDTSLLVVTVSFSYNDSNYGFVYERRHSALLEVKERDFLKEIGNQSFSQVQKGTNDKWYKWMSITPLPKNIFLLKQTVYWYQYGNSNKKFPVDRTRIEEILRQDIRDYLKRL